MRKLKLSKRAYLRKEIVRCFGKRFPAKVTADIHWQILEKLIQDLPNLDSGLKHLLREISIERSVADYFQMQHFNDPQLYRSFAEYSSASAALALLKKFPFGKVANLDPLGSAERNFNRAEKLCRITNRRLQWYRNRGYRQKNRWRSLCSIFHTARLLISDWLGPLDLNTIYDFTRHGPGGAVGVSGDATTAYFKYAAERYTVSTRALPYAEAAILADPLWRRYICCHDSVIGDPVPTVSEARQVLLKRLKVVNYNKVTFVPKTAQTHRAIAIEPLMNIFLQLGVGDYLSQNLRKVGLNLRSQTRNQILAREGSMWNAEPEDRPVTIDLSMASDTLSIELVRELLPEEWFNFLDSIRSEFGSYRGERNRWAKFSSMGNGFTFQLESMIFYALTLSVARHLGYGRSSISVYGDDIICPAGMALRLIDVLAYSGFTVNTSKSYLTGPFRESCGTDWFEGRDTRPFFLKRRIKNAKDLAFVFNTYGGLHSTCCYDASVNVNFGVDSGIVFNHLGFLQKFVFDLFPKVIKDNLLGPRSEDLEGHIHAPWDLAQKSSLVLWNRDVQAWSYPSVKAVSRVFPGTVGPIVLQMMGSNSCRGKCDFDDDLRRSEFFGCRLLSLEDVPDVAAPVNSGVVTKRANTKLRLATLTSSSWRND